MKKRFMTMAIRKRMMNAAGRLGLGYSRLGSIQGARHAAAEHPNKLLRHRGHPRCEGQAGLPCIPLSRSYVANDHPLVFKAFFSTSSSRSPSTGAASRSKAPPVQLRKLLAPLFLKVHPDTLGNCPEALKEANSASMQELNGFIDMAEKCCNGLFEEIQVSSGQRFNCTFFRRKFKEDNRYASDQSTVDTWEKVKCRIKISDALIAAVQSVENAYEREMAAWRWKLFVYNELTPFAEEFALKLPKELFTPPSVHHGRKRKKMAPSQPTMAEMREEFDRLLKIYTAGKTLEDLVPTMSKSKRNLSIADRHHYMNELMKRQVFTSLPEEKALEGLKVLRAWLVRNFVVLNAGTHTWDRLVFVIDQDFAFQRRGDFYWITVPYSMTEEEFLHFMMQSLARVEPEEVRIGLDKMGLKQRD